MAPFLFAWFAAFTAFVSVESAWTFTIRVSRYGRPSAWQVAQRTGALKVAEWAANRRPGADTVRCSSASSALPEDSICLYYDKAGNQTLDLKSKPSSLDDPAWTVARKAARETWNWCAHFVVPHNLCPWAPASVQTHESILMYVADTSDSLASCIELAAHRFRERLERGESDVDVQSAISFCIVAEKDWDFGSYYDWYVELEDWWLEQAEDDRDHVANFVTLAPFHPEWRFAGEEDDPLQFEKQSPYPTVSIVATSVIEKAGPAATAQIGESNARTLRKKTVEEWQQLYDKAILRS